MLKKNVNWEYVISAVSHCGLDNKAIFENKETLDKINSMFGFVQNRYNHKVSLLFNAFTEKGHGPKFKNYTNLYNVHSDSGGLQCVTLGKTIDAKMKGLIYKVQAQYSDVAMSLDVMPVSVDERSTKLDTGSRKFDSIKFEEMSRQSGKNLHEQINFFLEEKTTAKPLVILHGNDIDWYQRNLDFILDEIPQSKWKYIDGISCGSGAMGFGDLENIERAAVMAFIDAPEHLKNKYHVLGVGSLGRMLPIVSLLRNGAFNDNVHISYDSSSLTMSFTLGFYHTATHWCKKKLSQQYDDTFMEMYADVSEKSKIYWDLDIQMHDLYEMLCLKKGESDRKQNPYCYVNNAAVLLNSVMNFNWYLNRLTTDDDVYNSYIAKDKQSHNLKSLNGVNSKSDFLNWKKHYGKYFKSQRVVDNANDHHTLEDFFA